VVYGAMVGSILVYWIVVQVIRKVGQIPRGRDQFAAVDWARYPLYAVGLAACVAILVMRRHQPSACYSVGKILDSPEPAADSTVHTPKTGTKSSWAQVSVGAISNFRTGVSHAGAGQYRLYANRMDP